MASVSPPHTPHTPLFPPHTHTIVLPHTHSNQPTVAQVFERLGPSLFDFLCKNSYRPFPLAVVQQFARQMLQSVAYMHSLELVSVE